jgi:acetyl-CoA carboxylase carboxyltransferase component
VLARVLDGSEFDEFKPLYGSTLVTGWGHINGFHVGVLANNGILFSEESHKGAQFIQLCNRMDVPILFVQNITGFMVGTKLRAGRHHQGRRQAHQRREQLGVPTSR